MHLHCQSICQVAPHSGAESLKPEVHYPGSPNHSRNTDWRTYKQVAKHRCTFILIHKKIHIVHIIIYSLCNPTAADMAISVFIMVTLGKQQERTEKQGKKGVKYRSEPEECE